MTRSVLLLVAAISMTGCSNWKRADKKDPLTDIKSITLTGFGEATTARGKPYKSPLNIRVEMTDAKVFTHVDINGLPNFAPNHVAFYTAKLRFDDAEPVDAVAVNIPEGNEIYSIVLMDPKEKYPSLRLAIKTVKAFASAKKATIVFYSRSDSSTQTYDLSGLKGALAGICKTDKEFCEPAGVVMGATGG